MITSQAILSLSPTSCHFFYSYYWTKSVSQQINLRNDSPLSRKMSQALCECVNKVLPARRRLLGEEQKQGLLWEGFAPTKKSPKEAGNERQLVWGGVVSQRAQTPLCCGTGSWEKDAAASSWQRGVAGTSSPRSLESWNAGRAAGTGAAPRQMEMSCKVICLCQRWITHAWLGRGHRAIPAEFPPAGLRFTQGWDPEVVFNTLEYLNPFSLFHCLDSAAEAWGKHHRPRHKLTAAGIFTLQYLWLPPQTVSDNK